MNDNPEIEKWFDSMRRDFKRWYLASENPWRQSGWGSTPERWRIAREVILSAVEHSGAFLDVGCANGLLLECLMEWAKTRGIAIDRRRRRGIANTWRGCSTRRSRAAGD